MKNRVPVSAVILTKNEEKNIRSCLDSLFDLTEEIFLVDSGSTDRTVEIAKEYRAQIVFHPFETHAKQWNWAFQNLPIQTDWVLALDADQRLTAQVRDEIKETLKNCSSEVDGFYLCRRQIFRGQWIRHGGYYPKYLLKIFRRGKGHCDEKELLDFRFYVEGKTLKLKYDLIEENRKEWDIDFWISKHMRFAGLQAREEYERRKNGSIWRIKPSLSGTPDQQILWLKKIWYRSPLYIRPFLYFFYRYFFRFGFLDGKQGLIFHFFQGFWYRMLVDVKLEELEKDGY